jgi:multidrug efflux system membrane fusion protein
MKAIKILIVLALVVAGGWYGWGKLHHGDADKLAGTEPAAGGMPSGPVPVSVATLKAEPIQQWLQFAGRLVAVETVEVRPRVGGAIQTIYFEPGQIVEKNQPLFLIDPRPYEAEASRAKAALAGAEAEATLTQTDLERAQRLISENAISRRDVDTRQNANRVATAALKAARATVEQAELNLNYATIRAPVRGRISRAEITQGNLVNAASAPVLATIVSVDSIYADFEVDEQTYISMIRQQNGAKSTDAEAALPIELVLNSDDRADGAPAMSYPGKIVSFDNKLDTASGTIRARAIFENKDKALVPGMFANVRLGQAQAQTGIAIPDRLISTDQDKKYVYVVANDKVAYRPVTLGGLSRGLRIITSGLQDGDRIITDGLMKIRPDMPVTANEVPLTTSADIVMDKQAGAPDQPKPDALQPIAADKDTAAHADDVTKTEIPLDQQNQAKVSAEPASE